MDVNVKYPEPTIYQNLDPVGSIKYFSTYKDRSAQGFLPFDFDNAISIANYPKLFEEIGHIYNDQHVAAGDADLSGSSTLFYPTPVPGAYDRVAIPDSGDIDSTSAIDTGNDTITLSQADYNKFKRMKYYSDSYNGVPVYLKLESGSLPTGLNEDTIYYLRFTDDANYYAKLYISEANAIDDTSPVDITATATGTFRLTQEGINLDDAFQGHWHKQYANNNKADPGSNNTLHMLGNGTATNTVIINNEATQYPITDGTNGTPRTTNETRPKTNFLYGYIKAEYVTTAGEPISALRYDTGWVNSDNNWEFLQVEFSDCTFDLRDISYNIFYRTLGHIWNVTSMQATDNSTPTGDIFIGLRQPSGSKITLVTGVGGFYRVGASSGSLTTVDNSAIGDYRVIITKPNLVSTVFDVSSLPKTYDLTSGDVTVTLPEITGVLQTKSIYWENGGTYKLRIKDSEGNYLDYEGEGEGHIILESDGSNWQVRDYEDTMIIGGKRYIKSNYGILEYYGWGYIQGDGTSDLAVSGTLSKFVAVKNIIITSIGANSTTAPTDIDDLDIVVTNIMTSGTVTTTTWDGKLSRADSSTFSSTVYYGYGVTVKGTWK